MSGNRWLLGAVILATSVAATSELSAAPVAGADLSIPAPLTVVTSLHHYVVPPVTLTDQYGHKVRLDHALSGHRPALVQFFFTTCTTICGVRSAQLLAAAPKLEKLGLHIGFYTISIDPTHDSPRRLLAYSRHFGTEPPRNWHLLTGSVEQIRQVEAAFDASDPSGDKMMHKPLTFIYAGGAQPWQRINGLTSTRQLISLIQTAVAASR